MTPFFFCTSSQHKYKNTTESGIMQLLYPLSFLQAGFFLVQLTTSTPRFIRRETLSTLTENQYSIATAGSPLQPSDRKVHLHPRKAGNTAGTGPTGEPEDTAQAVDPAGAGQAPQPAPRRRKTGPGLGIGRGGGAAGLLAALAQFTGGGQRGQNPGAAQAGNGDGGKVALVKLIQAEVQKALASVDLAGAANGAAAQQAAAAQRAGQGGGRAARAAAQTAGQGDGNGFSTGAKNQDVFTRNTAERKTAETKPVLGGEVN
ncbi:hypothetical protein PCANC_06374 [Puccinia coronata f. sp. avenae]|nr:hypothetical protein PCANC_25068 [Puccinia coronata f. sp. avenae]PLW54081.1 hypothetical protein PCANC_06374 [Puccinia coronata f. sp. avenae]